MSATNSETSRREWAEVVFSMLLVAAVFVVLPTMGVTVPQEAKITAGLAASYIFGDGASDLFRRVRNSRSTDETTNDDRV